MYTMEKVKGMILLAIFGAIMTASQAASRTEFGKKWDSSYTIKQEMQQVAYDGESSKSSTYIYKRDEKLGRYQEWSKKWGLVAIEQKDASGTLWRYHHMDDKWKRCEKYKKSALDEGWISSGPMDKNLVNTYTEGNKMYLQYYYTYYDDEMGGRFKRWWTTVYDLETGSYLPYKRDEYWNDWESRYTFVTLTNYTYTPTTMKWTPLPDFCSD